MQNPPMDLIKNTAKTHHISLRDNNIECFFFVYAHVLHEAGNRLSSSTINKISIQEMKDALEQIYNSLAYFKGNYIIKETDRRYSDIENISPALGAIIARLTAMFELYDDTLPNPRRRPANLRIRNEAIIMYRENLLECRSYIIEVNYHIQWWCNTSPTTGCQDFPSTG
jgi:hypothetical protein